MRSLSGGVLLGLSSSSAVHPSGTTDLPFTVAPRVHSTTAQGALAYNLSPPHGISSSARAVFPPVHYISRGPRPSESVWHVLETQ